MSSQLLQSQLKHDTIDTDVLTAKPRPITLKEWKMIQRLRGLTNGRHLVCITVDNQITDWSILGSGRAEQ